MNSTATAHNIRGSLWHRWDLHFHTPSSFDYEDKSVTNQAIVDGLISNGIRVIAITDHLVIDVPRIRELQKLGGAKLTVLPGIELRSDQGGDPIHSVSNAIELAHELPTNNAKAEYVPDSMNTDPDSEVWPVATGGDS